MHAATGAANAADYLEDQVLPRKPPTTPPAKPPALSRAQKRAYATAVEDAGKDIARARGDAATISKKARENVMAEIDRVAARDAKTAKATKLAKRGYRPD